MTIAILIKSLVIAAVFVASSAHADSTIVIAQQDGAQTAKFKLHSSVCVLKGDVIRCSPASN